MSGYIFFCCKSTVQGKANYAGTVMRRKKENKRESEREREKAKKMEKALSFSLPLSLSLSLSFFLLFSPESDGSIHVSFFFFSPKLIAPILIGNAEWIR